MIHLALFGIEAGVGVWLTYLVHSTAWVAGALLLTRLDRVLSPAARHVVWRAALLGPLASSAFALGLGHGWQWALNPAPAAGEAWAAPARAALRSQEPFAHVERARDSAAQGALLPVDVMAPLPWLTLLASAAALVALVGVLLIARVALRQRRALEPRTAVTHAASLAALERLAERAGIRHRVRLSQSAAASTPLVLGAREICLPERALELDPAALEAVLAHELAHIERRDLAWLNGALFLQTLLWFQPLNRKARAELQASAELAADDRAVELTGDALGLARTLAEVASWASGAPHAASVAMARPGSPIVERVARLVESSEARPGRQLGPQTPWFALAALAAIGACSPSVGAPQAESPQAAPSSPQPDTTPLVPALASNVPAPDAASPPPLVPAHDALDSDQHEDPQDSNSDPADSDAAALDSAARAREKARERRRVARELRAQARERRAHAAPAHTPPTAPFPIQGMVSDVVAGVVPGAIEFGTSVAQMAMNEQHIEQQIQRARQAAAAPGAASELREELARLKRELAASTQRRQQLERDFEARMEAWSEDFERRFERDHAPQIEAWSGQLERRMQAMAKDIEQKLAPLRDRPLPVPPMPMIAPPRVPSAPPQMNAPSPPNVPAPPRLNAPSPPNVPAPPAPKAPSPPKVPLPSTPAP